MRRDDVQRNRSVVVVVELGPVERADDLRSLADDEPNPRLEDLPQHQLAVAQKPVDLFDRRLGRYPCRHGQTLSDGVDRQRYGVHRSDHSVGQRQNAKSVHVLGK